MVSARFNITKKLFPVFHARKLFRKINNGTNRRTEVISTGN